MSDTIELFVSECQNCEKCTGVLRKSCPRYAYWDEQDGRAWDDPHYTGANEAFLRKEADENPTGLCAAMVRAADGDERLPDSEN